MCVCAYSYVYLYYGKSETIKQKKYDGPIKNFIFRKNNLCSQLMTVNVRVRMYTLASLRWTTEIDDLVRLKSDTETG